MKPFPKSSKALIARLRYELRKSGPLLPAPATTIDEIGRIEQAYAELQERLAQRFGFDRFYV